jgi:hypothetical protein
MRLRIVVMRSLNATVSQAVSGRGFFLYWTFPRGRAREESVAARIGDH